MIILYDLIALIFTLFYLPVYMISRKFHPGFNRRLGCLPKNLNLDRPIWIHAVSVGEANAVKGLIAGLRKAYPNKRIVISTVTATGNKIAKTLVNQGDFLTYLPLDFSFIIRSVLKRIDPCIFIIAETEIWPNLISALYKQKIPAITVNGRISDSSYKGYRLIKFLIRPVLNKIVKFCVQTDDDALRLIDLGAARDKIRVTGNVKFDINLKEASQIDALGYRKKLMLEASNKLLVCGSTHPKEEEIIFNAYKELLITWPKLKLLIAPRHPERSPEIAKLAKCYGLMPILISTIPTACPTCTNRPVFILDIVGELFNYYSASDIVFIGGSMVKKGGHNIIEPASLKKPVIFGPHMFNFRQISELFFKNNAAIIVSDRREFIEKIKELLRDENLSKELSARAFEVIEKNKGATERNIEEIKQLNLT